MTLKAILKNKPSGFISVLPDAKISAVISTLAQMRIGAVLVIGPAQELLGILSERDIVRSLANPAANTLEMAAAQLMTANPTTGGPETTVAQAMEMMTEGHFRHLPIMENGHLTGLVSIGDVVKARIDQSEQEVETLRTYVAGG
jgi:CBS domain-containing protein